MDGVLEGAVVLCVCKLVSSLLFLPLLAESHSPVSFCSCCLLFFTDFLVTVWVVVALNVSWRSKLEEVLTSSCLHTTNSLVRCLPNLFSPMPSFVHPCWGIAFLSLLMLLLSTSTSLDGWHLILGCFWAPFLLLNHITQS